MSAADWTSVTNPDPIADMRRVAERMEEENTPGRDRPAEETWPVPLGVYRYLHPPQAP
jgi:hypothetical protein